MTNKQYSVADMLQLMKRLRTPETGCPWDLEQTYQTIVPSTIEEAYEVADAIERSDFDHLPEELGDLLFQVVFYSQIAAEEKRFDFDQVVHQLVDKLLRRHPHVFPDGTLQSVIDPQGSRSPQQDVKAQWEAIKAQERNAKGHRGVLDDVPVGLPALSRAQKLQKRAASEGFDWPSVDGVIDKIDEELLELRQAVAASDADNVAEELGDLLFSVVNACRHAKLDAEGLLRAANNKFESRFRYIEASLGGMGLGVGDVNSDRLNELWEQAKEQEKLDI